MAEKEGTPHRRNCNPSEKWIVAFSIMVYRMIVLLILFVSYHSSLAQIAYVKVDTADLNQKDKRGKKIGWWLIFADSTLTPTTKDKCVLKYYVYYAKGERFNQPIYYMKDKSEIAKLKRKYRDRKYTSINILKGNWDSDFADGDYKFIRYHLNDSTKYWIIESRFENGMLICQEVKSHQHSSAMTNLVCDYTIKYTSGH